MSDVLTPEQRHKCMSAIKGKDTKPEKIVRSMVHRMGYRFRLHKKDLPGKPDIVLPKLNKIIFVHGCFWHMHNCKYGRVFPKTNKEFWQHKREGNVIRDRRNIEELENIGWKVLIIWECEIKNSEYLLNKLHDFLRE